MLGTAGSANAWVAQARVEDFASAIEAMEANEAERINRANNGLRTASEYRWDKVAAAFLDLEADLHRAAMNEGGAIPAPAFSSTAAERLRLA